MQNLNQMRYRHQLQTELERNHKLQTSHYIQVCKCKILDNIIAAHQMVYSVSYSQIAITLRMSVCY